MARKVIHPLNVGKGHKLDAVRHEAVIGKNKSQQQEADVQIVDGEEEDQLFVANVSLALNQVRVGSLTVVVLAT